MNLDDRAADYEPGDAVKATFDFGVKMSGHETEEAIGRNHAAATGSAVVHSQSGTAATGSAAGRTVEEGTKSDGETE